MKHIFFIFTSVFLFLACMSDPGFTTDVSKELCFSVDTLRFDTLFTTLPSVTKWIKIYNPHKENIRIARIGMLKDSSVYRLNVDGQSGQSFSDIEIWGKDSLYIAVEMRPVVNGSDCPVKTEDELFFEVNGSRQKIVLSAFTWDAVFLRNQRIDSDTVFDSRKPIVVYDSLHIMKNVCLRITEGVQFFMHNKSTVVIDGRLICEGTSHHPILFRGDRFDKSDSSVGYDKLSGQWGGLCFRKDAAKSTLSYVEIRNATVGVLIDSMQVMDAELILHNSIIHNSSQSALVMRGGILTGRGCLFSNSGSDLMDLQGGSMNLLYCTVVNFYPYGNKGVCMNLNRSGMQVNLSHSILWGRKKNELILRNIPGFVPNDFSADYCLLKGKLPIPESSLTEILWDIDPQFRTINTESHTFDFRIGKHPVLEGFGKAVYIPDLKTDFWGIERDFDKPMIGAFAPIKE